MIYNYSITCTSATDILYFSYSDISGDIVEFNLSSGQTFTYIETYESFLIAPFPTNLFNFTTTIS